MDLAAFYGAYRQDGHGRAAFDPAVMVAVLLYAYARGIRSSRAIERACEEDVAFRVLAAHQVPDHTTIARFRQRHQDALARLFGEVLALCADAGPVCADVLAVDGTKIHANASERASCDYERLAREVLADADAIDAAEDERLSVPGLGRQGCCVSCDLLVGGRAVGAVEGFGGVRAGARAYLGPRPRRAAGR